MNHGRESEILEIQQWLKTQKFLPKALSFPFVQTFILGCDGNVEKAKTVISNYFYSRQSTPELFLRRDPMLQENIDSWNISCFVPLKGYQDGCKVFIGTAFDSDKYDYAVFAKQVFMCFDLLIKNNEWGNGDRIIVLSYEKVKDVTTYTIYITKKSTECESSLFLPGKLKAVHNVHVPPFMKDICERFKPYLSPMQAKSIMFHKNLKTLHKYVNPKILPLEFGGKAGSLTIIKDNWYEIMKQNRKFFIEEEENRMQEVKVKISDLEDYNVSWSLYLTPGGLNVRCYK